MRAIGYFTKLMIDIQNMVIEMYSRLIQSYRTLVTNKCRGRSIIFKTLLTGFALFCYPLVTLILTVIVLLVICITGPISKFSDFHR